MDQSFDSDNTLIKSENEWSEEHDGIPLKQRLKMLLASKHRSDLGDTKTQAEITAIPSEDIIVKKEADCISQDLHSTYFLGEGRVESLLLEKCHSGKVLEGGRPREWCIQKIEPNTCNFSNQIVVSELNCGIVRAEEDIAGDVTVNNLASSPVNYLNDSSGAEGRAINIKTELPDNIFDDLDHIDLRERRRMLLSRKSLESTKPVGEDSISGLPNFVVDCMHNAVIGNEDNNSIGKECSTEGNCLIECSTEGIHSDDIPERSAAVFCKNLEFGSSNSMVAGSSNTIPHCPASVRQSRGTESTRSGNFKNVNENDRVWSSKITSNEFESCGEKDVLSEKHNTVLNSALKTFVNVKVEPLDNNEADKNALDNSCLVNIVPVKSELDFIDAYSVDVIDHMLLRDRMKLLTSRRIQNTNIYAEGSREIMPSALDFKPILSKSATPLRIKRTRKRKKTATDSVETALEEDAPGLLQVLVDKGVVVDEIKLYGQTEIDEALDDSLTEDSFTELEAVISKLFSQRHSLLKLPPVRSTKCEKTSYCLACLISLVEQARYLQFRKWPVEWGWCRDLQSFIFVFERHNRIVLERPEYGYATYFFELLDSVPIDWQIKRLVTAMKLTSCSRVTLIENKALTVGEDLTQGEAAVLTGYGWIPDTGLGTMLNYRDRVVHDRKNEKDNSEWRSKIGKLLMDGYNGGTIITTDIPKKVIEYDVAQSPQIKLEL